MCDNFNNLDTSSEERLMQQQSLTNRILFSQISYGTIKINSLVSIHLFLFWKQQSMSISMHFYYREKLNIFLAQFEAVRQDWRLKTKTYKMHIEKKI